MTTDAEPMTAKEILATLEIIEGMLMEEDDADERRALIARHRELKAELQTAKEST